MVNYRSLRFAALTAIVSLCVFHAAPLARGQGKGVSLGEAARRLREQHKPSGKAIKVWTNEEVSTLSPFGVNVVGPIPESLTKDSSGAPAKKEDEAPASAEAREKELKDAEAALAGEKAQLETLTKELDLQQRDLSLFQQQFYSNPGYNSDSEGKAKLDAMNAQIAANQGEIQKSKDKITELEAKIAKLKAPAAPAPRSPSQP
jgi:predicted RNase H-like nuclease (RuvC/YqgF family)